MKRDDAALFRAIRPLIGGADKKLTADQVAGVNALLAAFDQYGDGDLRKLANILGQVQRETGGLMTPVREGFTKTDAEARAYVKRQGYKYAKPTKYGGQVAYGRGPIQNTWDYNYEKMDKRLGLNGKLLANFDLALDPVIGAQIAVIGMMEGIFTGKKLGDYFNTVTNWQQARRVVNGMDHADEVATNSKRFHAALLASIEPDANSDMADIIPAPEPPPPAAAKEPVHWAGAATAAGGAVVATQATVQSINSTVTTIRDTASQTVDTVTTIKEGSQGLAAWLPSPPMMVFLGVILIGIGIATIYLRHRLAKEQGV
ncbi:glycoside hydrolase family 19 protein [Labrys sp. (in: a-proteobacteria)]|uniref:glycoside hydrolase family 19 protein n=1 Tax=Labrys sp. (in: a-proteobacteria) TaxID=1917972 RepID=UPI0039E6B50A